MTPVFADANYWIAILHPNDKLHLRANELQAALSGLVITHELALSETLDFFSRQGPYWRLRASRLAKDLKDSKDVRVLPVDSELFDAALKLYEKAKDQQWGHADCVSFELMKNSGISEALTYDRHFIQAGFTALLREEAT